MRKNTRAAENQVIEDEVSLGLVPVTPNAARLGVVAGTDEHKATLTVDPKEQYVAGGTWVSTGNLGRALPYAIDDISAEFGADIYERMMLDPQVNSCFLTVVLGIVSQGWTVQSAVTDDSDPEYKQADDIAQLCRRSLEKVNFTAVLVQMLQALMFGNKIAEVIYEVPDTGPDAGKLCLKDIRPKPRQSVAFVVDAYMDLIGILGRAPGAGMVLQTGGFILKPEDSPNLFPLDKFFILTHSMKDSIPSGTSIGRAAFAPWQDKQNALQRYARWQTAAAGGLLIGTTAEGAQPVQNVDANGNPVFDVNNNPVVTTPEQAMVNAMVQFQDMSAAAFPFGAKVEPLMVGDRGEGYTAAVNLYNDEISKAMTGQTLATNEGRHQARAASETHADILDLHIQQGKNEAENAVNTQLLRMLTLLNFGEKALHLTPKFSLSDSQLKDFAANATAIASLVTAGFFIPEQYSAIDAWLGSPPRPENWQELQQKRTVENAKQMAKVAPDGKGADGGKPDES